MISEFLGRLKTWLQEQWAAMKARPAAATSEASRAVLVARLVHILIVASASLNLLKTRMRFHNADGHIHAPIFSLYTFFASR
jgi:hypothetical protein